MSTAEELLATPCASKEHVKAMLKKIPGRADLAGRDGFSLAEAMLKNIEPRWEALKTEGNAALAAGDLERAIERYTAALDVATQPGPQIRALKAAAAAADEGSPLHRALADPVPVLFKVCEYLPAAPAMDAKRECGPVKMKLTTPRKAGSEKSQLSWHRQSTTCPSGNVEGSTMLSTDAAPPDPSSGSEAADAIDAASCCCSWRAAAALACGE